MMKDTKNKIISDCINLLIIYLRTISTPQHKNVTEADGSPRLPRILRLSYGLTILLSKLKFLDLCIPVIECGDVRSYGVHVDSLS